MNRILAVLLTCLGACGSESKKAERPPQLERVVQEHCKRNEDELRLNVATIQQHPDELGMAVTVRDLGFASSQKGAFRLCLGVREMSDEDRSARREAFWKLADSCSGDKRAPADYIPALQGMADEYLALEAFPMKK